MNFCCKNFITLGVCLSSLFSATVLLCFWGDQKQSTETEVNEVIEENSRFMTTGLNTGLKPTFGVKTAKHGSDNLEGFLSSVEKTSSRRLLNADGLNTRTEKQLKFKTSFKN